MGTPRLGTPHLVPPPSLIPSPVEKQPWGAAFSRPPGVPASPTEHGGVQPCRAQGARPPSLAPSAQVAVLGSHRVKQSPPGQPPAPQGTARTGVCGEQSPVPAGRAWPWVTAVLLLLLLQFNPGRNIPAVSCCSFPACAAPPPICSGRKSCRCEIIVFNLFCPQTMVKSPSCRQEGTSSPSLSSSPSKFVGFCCLNVKGKRSCSVLGRADGAPRSRTFQQSPPELLPARTQDPGYLLRGKARQRALLGESQTAQTLVDGEKGEERVHRDRAHRHQHACAAGELPLLLLV